MNAQAVTGSANAAIESALVAQQVAVRTARKQRDVVSEQGEALVALIESARALAANQAAANGGIDVIA